MFHAIFQRKKKYIYIYTNIYILSHDKLRDAPSLSKSKRNETKRIEERTQPIGGYIGMEKREPPSRILFIKACGRRRFDPRNETKRPVGIEIFKSVARGGGIPLVNFFRAPGGRASWKGWSGGFTTRAVLLAEL